MTDLYFIRHGETESNRERRYQGWTESPLSETGIRQAEKASFFLAGASLDGLFCSDLQRAAATARVIGAGCGLAPVTNPLLREIHFGRWEGLTYDEIEAKWGEEISLWHDDPYNRSTPGGETLAAVSSRMLSFAHSLVEQYPACRRVAAVSHGGSIRALLYRILGLDRNNFWDIRIDNASVTLVRLEGQSLKVVYYNRTDHLQAGEKKGVFEDGL